MADENANPKAPIIGQTTSSPTKVVSSPLDLRTSEPGGGPPIIDEANSRTTDDGDVGIADALEAAGANDDRKPFIDPDKLKEPPAAGIDPDVLGTKAGDGKKDDFEFPDSDLPAAALGAEEPGETDGIIKKYYQDELSDEQRKLIEPLAKALKSQQQGYSSKTNDMKQLADTVSALQQKLEKLSAQDQIPAQPSDKEKPEQTSDAELTEDKINAVLESEGVEGVLKLMNAQQAKQYESQSALLDEKLKSFYDAKQAETKQVDATRMQKEAEAHNEQLFTARAREILRDRAIQSKDRQAYERYNRSDYRPSDQEVASILKTHLQPEVEMLQSMYLPDQNGRYSRDQVSAVRNVMYRDHDIKAAETRGYERGKSDKSASIPRTVNLSPPSGARANGNVKGVNDFSDYRDMQTNIAGLTGDQADAELAKLRGQLEF